MIDKVSFKSGAEKEEAIAGCEGVSTFRAKKIVRNAEELAAQPHHAQGSRIIPHTRYRSTFVISITHFDVRRNFAMRRGQE